MDLIARTWHDFTRQPPRDARSAYYAGVQAALNMMVRITAFSPLSQGIRIQELRDEMARFHAQEGQ